MTRLAIAVRVALLLPLWAAQAHAQDPARDTLRPHELDRVVVIASRAPEPAGRVVATVLEPLPVTAMKSRIRDVVYVNYLIPAERARGFVPEGLELDRLGEGGELALFTFLSFRHQAFGFRFLGPLRELSPPAVQTNWRVHVRDPRTGQRGIVFLTNAIDRIFPALGARLFTEGMPMHWLARASIAVASRATWPTRWPAKPFVTRASCIREGSSAAANSANARENVASLASAVECGKPHRPRSTGSASSRSSSRRVSAMP